MLLIMMFKPHGHRAARMAGILSLLRRFKLLLGHLMQMNGRLLFLITGIVGSRCRLLFLRQIVRFFLIAFKRLSRENGLFGFLFSFFFAFFVFSDIVATR